MPPIPKTIPNLKQIVGQYETNIITLTNMDLGEGGYNYTIHRRINSATIASDTFTWDEAPNVNWGNYGISFDVTQTYSDSYKSVYLITCGDFNSNENAVVTIESTGISASIVTNQGYASSYGFDNDFVEVDLKDYPYYPFTPAAPEGGIFRNGFNDVVYSTFVQTDGKVLVGGDFDNYNYYNYSSTYANKLIRLNQDGSPDKTFNTIDGFNDRVESISVQTDGKILVGGYFNKYNGVTQSNICRLNVDGTLDTTFNTGTGFLKSGNKPKNGRSIEIQPDGKILVVADFDTYNGVTQNSICRLNVDGTLDTSFVIGDGFNGTPYTIKYLSIGKILVGGAFGQYNGTTSNYLILLNIDGSIDTTFNVDSSVLTIEEQTDGRILIGGSFTTFNGTGASRFIRLLPYAHWGYNIIDMNFNQGNFDSGFDGPVSTIKQQSDGKILVGGEFQNYYDPEYGWYESYYLTRLNSNGSVDITFNESNNVINLNNPVNSISIQSDNKIIVGGNFDNYSSFLVRLYSGLEAKYFSPKFMGEVYNKIAVGSNSYLTFGGGSKTNSFGQYDPNLPGVFISSGDRSYQRVWVGTDYLSNLGGFAFKVRYEGGVDVEWYMGDSPQVEWEICFLEDGLYETDSIDIKIGANDGYVPNFFSSFIRGKNYIAKYFEAKPNSSFLLPAGWGKKQTKLDVLEFNPGTTVYDQSGRVGVNLPVASADWNNNSGNTWGLRTYNGGNEITLSSGNPANWFNFSQIPGYVYGSLRGGIIEYHAFASGTCNGTIIGSITFAIDTNGNTITHTENLSGSNLEYIILWREDNLYGNPGSIQVVDTTGGTTQLMIQWTSRLFFGNDCWC